MAGHTLLLNLLGRTASIRMRGMLRVQSASQGKVWRSIRRVTYDAKTQLSDNQPVLVELDNP